MWISRGDDREGRVENGGTYAELRDRTAFEWRFDTIGDFAEEVERQFAAKEEGGGVGEEEEEEERAS